MNHLLYLLICSGILSTVNIFVVIWALVELSANASR